MIALEYMASGLAPVGAISLLIAVMSAGALSKIHHGDDNMARWCCANLQVEGSQEQGRQARQSCQQGACHAPAQRHVTLGPAPGELHPKAGLNLCCMISVTLPGTLSHKWTTSAVNLGS